MNSRVNPTILGLVAATVVAVTVAFYRNSSDVFDLTKGTLLWIGAVALLVPLVASLAGQPSEHLGQEIRSSWSIGAFLIAAWATSLLSSDFIGLSVFGEAGRYTSLLTLTAGAVLFLAVRRLTVVQVKNVFVVLVGCHVVSGIYALIQAFDADPFEWQSGSFGRFVFGTMGNPNFASILASVGSVLASFFLVDSKSSGPLRVFSGFALFLGVGLLGLFDSFQGNVALLTILGVVAYVLVTSGFPLSTILLSSLASLVLVGVSFRIDTAGVALGLSLFGAVVGAVLHRYLSTPPATTIERRIGKRQIAFVSAGLLSAVVGAVVLLRGTISSGFSDGFVERGDFYRAGWAAFLDRPVFGYGLDTFGKYFTQYRPVGHALTLEPNRTSSVHSVYLGLLFSGGIILFLAFLVMVVHPVAGAFRVLRKRQSPDPGLLVGLLGGLSSLLIVFLVSTEHVAVHAIFFVVLGGVSRLALPPSLATVDLPKRSRSQRKKAIRKRVTIASGLTAVVSVALLPILIKPFLAARSDFLGQTAYFANDPQQAMYEFQRAGAAAPWVSTYRLRTAEMAVNLELPELARSEAYQVAVRGNFVGVEAVKAAQVLGLTRDLDRAMFVLERAWQHDPFALELGKLIQDLAQTVADVADREGEPELASRARILIDQIVQTRNELSS